MSIGSVLLVYSLHSYLWCIRGSFGKESNSRPCCSLSMNYYEIGIYANSRISLNVA